MLPTALSAGRSAGQCSGRPIRPAKAAEPLWPKIRPTAPGGVPASRRLWRMCAQDVHGCQPLSQKVPDSTAQQGSASVTAPFACLAPRQRAGPGSTSLVGCRPLGAIPPLAGKRSRTGGALGHCIRMALAITMRADSASSTHLKVICPLWLPLSSYPTAPPIRRYRLASCWWVSPWARSVIHSALVGFGLAISQRGDWPRIGTSGPNAVCVCIQVSQISLCPSPPGSPVV